MKTSIKDIEISNQIIDYLNNNTSEEEVNAVLDWVNQSEENKIFFNKIHDAWELEQADSLYTKRRIDKQWEKFESKLYPAKKNRVLYPMIRIAASILILLGFSYLVFTRFFLEKEQVFMAETSIKETFLPDSSLIVIKPGSKVIVSKNYNKKYRELSLRGEAFFNVKKDETKPFILRFGNNKLEVLGTSFVVREFKNEEYHVFVKEGKVRIVSQTDKTKPKKVILSRGEKCQLSPKKLEKESIANVNYLSWYDKVFYFDNTPLDEVAKVLSHSFETKIIFSSPVNDLKLSARFEKEPLDVIVQIIGKTFSMNTMQDSTGWVIGKNEKETN